MTPEDSQRHNSILEQLLAAAGERADTEGQADVLEFDWSVPRHFTNAQMERIVKFTDDLAGRVSAALTRLLRAPLDLRAEPLSQHYRTRLTEADDWQDGYWADICDDRGNQVGLVVLPPACAIGWVSMLLGVPPQQAADGKQLSNLEGALLGDAIGAIVEAFSNACQESGGGKFSAAEKITAGRGALPGDRGEEFCRIVLADEQDPQGQWVWLVLPADVLDPIGDGGQAVAQTAQGKTVDMRARMEAHFERSTVTATVLVGRATAKVRDVLALESGDVLLVDKKAGEPIEVVVQGKVVLSGMPVTCEQNYGVQVTVPAGEMAANRHNG